MRVFRESFKYLVASCLLSLVVFQTVRAQEAEPADEKLPDTPAVKAFQEAKAKVDKLNKDIEGIFAKARTLTRDDIDEIKKLQVEYEAKRDVFRKELAKLSDAAVAALKDAPQSATVGEVLLQMAMGEVQSDQYDKAYQLVAKLIESKNTVNGLNDVATMAAFGRNDFEAAKKHLELAIANKEVQKLSQRFSAESLAKHIADWKKELEIRTAEAEKNDLPRVQMETTEGNIVIELYENEAPQAVANFVSLVEKKYYDGLVFHRVLPGFMAQGGCPQGTGTGGPGYNIYCECYQDNFRKHFAGTLSMAHAGRNTGGSQFFLTFLPTPHLDGRHTAFGRVIEGMDVLGKLNRVNPNRPSGEKPSKIVKATVIRKRDHDYKPTKVE